VRNLVEAFLEDRQENAALYTLAHRIGWILVNNFKCPYTEDEETGDWVNTCEIPALHRRIAFSVAWFWTMRCSICGATDLDCDHVPGAIYDGEVCSLDRDQFVGFDHVAVVTEPDFTHTFIQPDRGSKAEIERQFGGPLPEGMTVFCNHCRNCAGYFGPTEEDLDPSLWPPLGSEDALDDVPAVETTDGSVFE
jgi:hypothetical protein